VTHFDVEVHLATVPAAAASTTAFRPGPHPGSRDPAADPPAFSAAAQISAPMPSLTDQGWLDMVHSTYYVSATATAAR